MERISIEEAPEFWAHEEEEAAKLWAHEEEEAAKLWAEAYAAHEASVAAYLAYKDEGYPFGFEDFVAGVTI